MEKGPQARYITAANAVSLLRIVLIPPILCLLLEGRIGIAFLTFMAAISTDLLDGYLARRYNQLSELGLLLDPLADKLIQIAVITTLAWIGYSAWIFALLLMVKEVITIIIGAYIFLRYRKTIKANRVGKVASFALNMAIALSFFHPLMREFFIPLDLIALTGAMALTYLAMAIYMTGLVKDRKSASGAGASR